MFATGPFGEPVFISELSTDLGEDDPTLTADMLEIYFKSDRDGNVDIFESTPASRSDAWSVPVVVAELSSADDDYAAARDP